jgi:hypothetical protein
MADENWRRLADYVVAGRVALGMRDRRALAAATGVTERTLGKLENGHRVSASTLAAIENRLGWAPGSCRRILAGGEPVISDPIISDTASSDPVSSGVGTSVTVSSGQVGAEPFRNELLSVAPIADVTEATTAPAPGAGPGAGPGQLADPTLEYLADTPGLPPEVVRGLIALARNWRQVEAAAQDEADTQISADAERRRA